MFDPDSITPSQLNDLRGAAEQAWADDTRSEAYVGHPQPSAGHCYVTSQWLTQKLGGHVGERGGHYFWVSPDRTHVIDMTGDRFASPPRDEQYSGLQLDADDEPWEMPEEHKQWRPGPTLYKRADHPMYKGFRVLDPLERLPNQKVVQRAKRFADRANAALHGERVSRTADLLGADPYPGESPEKVEDMNRMPFHDEPEYTPDHETHEFQFMYANGQMHVSPAHSHAELANHALVSPNDSGPMAVGYATVTADHVTWRVTSNIAMRDLASILKDYSNTVGWQWDGMVDSKGQPIHDDFGAVQSMWYRHRKDGHLVLSPHPLPRSQQLRIEGKTAYVRKADDALREWASDFGYKLAEYPGGGNFTDQMKNREHLDIYNRGDPNWSPEQTNTDAEPSGPLACGTCGLKFPSLAALRLHHRDHEPWADPIEDGHFPQIHDFDDPLGFGSHPIPNGGETIAKTAVMVLPNHKTAARFPRFSLYSGLFDYAHDDNLRFYGAYRNGQLVGYGAVRLDDEPEVLMIDAVRHGSGIGSAILSLIQRHFDHFYTHADSKAGERLMRRLGVVNVRGHLWRYAAGSDPKDMIEAAIPFIYDTQMNAGGGTIHIGYPGQSTHDIPGRFTPGGIVEGYYEPGGKVVLIGHLGSGTVRHFANLWYSQFPHMEITSVEHEDRYGETTKLAAEAGYMYHVAPQEHRESIQRNGLNPQGRGFDVSQDDWLNNLYGGARPVYLSHVAGQSADTRYDTTGKDIWRVNTQGLPLVADLPGLYDNGANHEDGYAWWNEGYTPPALAPYDEEEGIPHEALLDPTHPASQAAIQTTQTAAHLGPIPPERLQLVNPTTSKIAAQDVGHYMKTLVSSEPAAMGAYQALRQAGGKVYVVGGAIRDALQQRQPNDLDLMVGGLPTEKVNQILETLPGRVDLTGKRFGVYRYRVSGQEVEISLPRQDQYETSRRGEGVITVDHNLPVEKDLQRRDFTANSMAVDLDSGRLVDPYGGADDIEKHILRTTHPDSFSEDPTRLVRALVAHGRFGLNPDERTRHEMETNGHLLQHESPDALNTVLTKLFASSNPASAIRLAQETGVLRHLFPEVAENFDYDQNNPHHSHKLGDHLLQVLSNVSNETTDPDLRLAALYHDVGKPASAWTDPERGTTHYYQGPNGQGANHEDVGARMVYARMRALNYPVARINRVRDLVAQHMFPAFSTHRGARRFLQKTGPYADDLLTLRHADMTGKGQSEDELGERTSVDTMRQLVDEARLQQAPTDLQNLAVNGNDLIAMGVQPGPQIGTILRQLLDDVVQEPTLNDRDTLLQRAQTYVNAQQ